MNEEPIAEDAPHWTATLPTLRRLSSEIDAGIRALAREDLAEFEKRVAAQGEICDLLIQTKLFTVPPGYPAQARRLPANASSPSQPDKSPATTILKDVVRDLAQQSRLYSALLRRAKRYTHILLSVYRSRLGYLADGSVPTEGTTWSSEV
jgi:hypothetical protein